MQYSPIVVEAVGRFARVGTVQVCREVTVVAVVTEATVPAIVTVRDRTDILKSDHAHGIINPQIIIFIMISIQQTVVLKESTRLT